MNKALIQIIFIIFILFLSSLFSFQTAKANEYFIESFDDNIADRWTQKGSWTITKGEYCTSAGVTENVISTVDNLNVTNYSVETKFRFTDSLGFRAGIVFRYLDENNYYAFELSNEYDTLFFCRYLTQKPDYGTIDYVWALSNGYSVPTHFDFTTGQINAGVEYTLRVSVNGDTFTGSLSSQGISQTITWTDSSYESGKVGLRARAAGAAFEYFQVDNINSTTPTPSPNPTSTANPSLNDGLVGYWKLNEGSGTNALDSSGNSFNGIINGATWVNNIGIKALEFNGVSGYVTVPSLPISSTGSLSVVAWINSDFSKTGYIFYHGDTGEFMLHNGERFADGPVAGRYPNLASFSVKLSGSTWHDVYSESLEPNVWHQIVGVWEKANSLKIYVDGTLAGQNTAIASGNLLTIGSSWLPLSLIHI